MVAHAEQTWAEISGNLGSFFLDNSKRRPKSGATDLKYRRTIFRMQNVRCAQKTDYFRFKPEVR